MFRRDGIKQSDLDKINNTLNEIKLERDKLQKQVNTLSEPVFAGGVSGKSNQFYGRQAVSGIGNNKAVLTEWWLNPLYGQPRLLDLRTVKYLSRHNVGSMCVEKILDIIAQQSWTIRPKRKSKKSPRTKKQFEGDQDRGNPAHIDFVTEFFTKPNRNNESFDTLIRKVLRNILETDDGVGVKVFDEYDELPHPKNIMVGGQEVEVGERIPRKNSQMIELWAEDGSSFLKAVDIHGYLMNYWQYSFILPRVPIPFLPREIMYISQNPRAGSPYGYSPFESIVDWLIYLIKAGKYNERFYENSAYPSFQLDLANVKTRDDMEAWAEWFRKNYMGTEKAWQVLLTNQGSKVVPLTFDNRALQNLETQTFYLYLCCAKLKIPPTEVGLPTNAPRAQAGQQRSSFRSIAIRPLTKILERAINVEIMPELDPDDCCEFSFIEYSDLEEEERRSYINATNIQNSIKTPNEIREEMDLEPLEGLDTTMRQFQQEQQERMAQFKTQAGGLDAQQQQNAQARTAQKRPASEFASYGGARHKSTEPEYIGVCTTDNEDVFTDNILKHQSHVVLRDGKFVNLKKVFGHIENKLETSVDEFTTVIREQKEDMRKRKEITDTIKKRLQGDK